MIAPAILRRKQQPQSRQRVIIGYRAAPSTVEHSGPGYRIHKEIRVNRIRRTAGALVGPRTRGPVQRRRISGWCRVLPWPAAASSWTYSSRRPTRCTCKGYSVTSGCCKQRNRLLRLRRDGRARPDEMEFLGR